MRLEVTRRADLAVQALAVLAQRGTRMKAPELAEVLGTTRGFVPQVLGPLIERRWVRSEPGPTGGYAATVRPEDVSLLDVIEAVDGPTDSGRCVVEDRPCNPAHPCVLHAAWTVARAHLVSELGGVTLAQLPATERSEVASPTTARDAHAASRRRSTTTPR